MKFGAICPQAMNTCIIFISLRSNLICMLSIPKRPLHTCTVLILWDKNFYWDINFAILLMADFLNSNFRNLSMI